MGEIGYNRHEYLYDLLWWEIDAIVEGYHARCRHLWSSTRWQTYHIMSAFAGSQAMRESGICKPEDLIRFVWEEDSGGEEIDDDYVKEMQDLIASVNSQNEEKA